MGTYLDIDDRGHYSIHELTPGQLHTIILSLLNYRTPREQAQESLSGELGMHLYLQQNLLIKDGSDKVSPGES